MVTYRIVTLLQLLITLAIFDTLYISFEGSYQIIRKSNLWQPYYMIGLGYWYRRLYPFIHPFRGFAFTGSAYCSVLVTLERYLGICHPNTHLRFRRFKYYVGALGIICLVINCLKFFEWKVSPTPKYYNVNAFDLEPTVLMASKSYRILVHFGFDLLTNLTIPFVVILCFNLNILSYYKQNR